MMSHVHSLRTHSRPGGPQLPPQRLVLEQIDQLAGELAPVASADDVPGPTGPHRIRRAAGVTGHHRQTDRRRFQIDDAQPLDVQPGASGAARHGEDVTGGVVPGSSPRGDPAGEHDVLGDALIAGKRAKSPLVGPGADEQQRGARHLAAHGGQCAHQRVLPLARHQS